MTYVFGKKSILLVFLCLGLGCAPFKPDDGGYKVRIPLDDGTGHYRLRTVSIRSVPDLSTMSGSTAVLLNAGHLKVDLDGENYTYEKGNSPTAHFLKSGDTWYPSDFPSLSMVTALYHFEALRDFYGSIQEANGKRATDGIDFPRTVLYDFDFDRIEDHKDQHAYNNAAYSPPFDVFMINPNTRATNIPVGMNGGVLAHEFLHNVFQIRISAASANLVAQGKLSEDDRKSLAKPLHQSFTNEWLERQYVKLVSNFCAAKKERTGPKFTSEDTKNFNKLILSSINEAVADYFGYEYSGNHGWILPSMPAAESRDPEFKRSFDCSSDAQKAYLWANINHKEKTFDEHELGAYFVHFLYEVAKIHKAGSAGGTPDFDVTRKNVLTFMTDYAQAVGSNFHSKFLSMGDVVKIFLKIDSSPEVCRKAQEVFPTELGEDKSLCTTKGVTL